MSFLEGIPDILYKYRSWSNENHKRILTENELYLASASQFNDPYDFSLPYRYKKEDLTSVKIFLKLREVGKREFGEISEAELHLKRYERQMSGVFETGAYWKEIHAGFVNMLHTTFGILSLTSKRDNFLMWSHYSDSHKGFCVGFDKELLISPLMGQFGKVNYSTQIPEIGLFDESLAGFISIFSTKSKVWEYEDEYRLVKHNSAKKTVYFNPDAIREIILGCNMPEKEKIEVVNFCASKFVNATIYESVLNLEEFRIDLFPIVT